MAGPSASLPDGCPGREALTYYPSKVSWATAEFLRRPPAFALRAFVYLLVAATVTLAIYGYFAEVVISVTARGALVTESPVVPIVAAGSMRVAVLNAANNAQVKRGELLLASDDQLSRADEALIKADTKRALETVARYRAHSCGRNCYRELASLAETAFRVSNAGAIRNLLAPVQEKIHDLANHQKQVENFWTVMASAQRQKKIAESKLREIQKLRAEKLLDAQVEQLRNDISVADSQIADRRQNLETQGDQLTGQLEVKLNNLGASTEEYANQQIIVAPVDGMVSHLGVSAAGQYLSAGQPVLEIVPAKSDLEAELDVANKDISQVKVGSPVRIKLDALPEQDYGSVEGKVRSIPIDVAKSTDPHPSAIYKVRVQLTRQSLERQGTVYPLKLGMTLNGLVISRHERLISHLLRKILNLKEDLFNN